MRLKHHDVSRRHDGVKIIHHQLLGDDPKIVRTPHSKITPAYGGIVKMCCVVTHQKGLHMHPKKKRHPT
jgi:hypothetical protein